MPASRLVTTLAAAAVLIHLPAAQARETRSSPQNENIAAGAPVTPAKSGHVTVNGLSYYYEIYGQGEPLLLLHGGLGNIGMFHPILPLLAAHRQVIAVDLHGHGRTALGERELDLLDMGDDMAGLAEALGYRQVDVMGYSLGGGVAFRFAVQHPGKVRRLVLVSAGYATDGFFPELRPMQAQIGADMAQAFKGTPMYESYMAVAPHPGDFPKLLDRLGALMRKSYDWSEDVSKLTMPVMLVYGDSDMYRPEHIVAFYKLLGGGLRDAGWMREHMSRNRLAILPGLTHYDIFFSPALVATVLPFLDGAGEPAGGAGQAVH